MARDKEEIAESLAKSIKTTDPSVDATKGAIFNFLIKPVSEVLEGLEANVEHLTGLYSTAFSTEATTEEVEALATNFSVERDQGKKAAVTMFFSRRSQPRSDEILNVPAGTLVSNIDSTLIYRVVDDLVLDGSNASSFFNASRGTFEVSGKVEAVQAGASSNLPAFRINKILSSLPGFDLTENRDDATGGSDIETDSNLVKRIEKKFSGLNTGTLGGLESTIRNFSPTIIKDVSIVQPTDVEFKRLVNSLALDIYIIGEDLEINNQVFTASGGETLLKLNLSPVKVINSVTINGIPITSFQLSLSSDISTKFSPIAEDFLVFDNPLSANDVVVVNHSYNKLIVDLHEEFKNRLFGTNILVRQFVPLKIIAEATVKVTQSIDDITILDSITKEVIKLVELNSFIDSLSPGDLEEKIKVQVAGILSFNWKKFKKSSKSALEVETIDFNLTEVPRLDSSNFKITVLR